MIIKMLYNVAINYILKNILLKEILHKIKLVSEACM